MKTKEKAFHPRNFTAIGEWFAAVFEAKRGVPTAVPWGITRVMNVLGIGFHEAFDLLVKEDVIIAAGTGYVIDLSGPERVIERCRRQ